MDTERHTKLNLLDILAKKMRKFGWKKWKRLHSEFEKSKRPSIERWGLAYLHSNESLDALAYSIANVLRKSGKHSEVSIESIWIDGTPQAKAKTPSGSIIECELADLLFILEEKNMLGTVLQETGLLIQGKATPKYNKLTSGSSTKKERQLLEGMDRSQPIELYRDTKKSSRIDSYNLGCIPLGLSDCSRYLLMPKSTVWFCRECPTVAPFQVGWPKSTQSSYLQSPRGIVEAIQRMALFGDIGKSITDPLKCEWSRLVKDLRGNYSMAQMAGYGGQPRVNASGNVISFVSSRTPSHLLARRSPSKHPPANELLDSEGNIPPSISIVKVTLTNHDDS